MIIGVPLAGARIGTETFDGQREAAIFPGDLPDDPASLLQPAPLATATLDTMQFLRFRPPRVSLESPAGDAPALPHIRLDRAIDFLIGDRLV